MEKRNGGNGHSTGNGFQPSQGKMHHLIDLPAAMLQSLHQKRALSLPFVLLFLQVNCVVMRGVNEEEICDFVALTKHKVS